MTQYFPGRDDCRGHLIYLADVMCIRNKLHRFHEPHNYTSYLAALLWMYHLLMMKYVLLNACIHLLSFALSNVCAI